MKLLQNKFASLAPYWVLILLGLALGTLLALALWWLLEHEVLTVVAHFNTWLADNVLKRMGYWGVFFLMAVESSFLPFPSEIVMPPAGDLARRLPDWSMTGVILAGTLGSLLGALINYGLARWLGRPLILKWLALTSPWLRLSVDNYLRAERMFFRYGYISTFAGRLLPVIRQLISLPAGLSRVPLVYFSLLTALGAGIWVTLLAWLGFRFGQDHHLLTQQLKQHSILAVVIVCVLVACWIIWYFHRRRTRHSV